MVSLVCALLGACTVDTTLYDPFGIPVDVGSGATLLGARLIEGDAGTAVAALDTGSPITIFKGAAAGAESSSILASVELIGAGTGVPRARFDSVHALLSPAGAVGETIPRPIGAVIGGDLLSLHALRIDVSSSALRIFPNVSPDDTTLADSCLGSFNTTLAGGGSFQLRSNTVRFPASRIVLSVCLAPPFDCDLTGACPGGADTLLLVSTAVRPMVLSRTTFERMTGMGDAEVDALSTTTLFLPGSLSPAGVTVHQATVSGMAIADRGAHGDDNPARGACLEWRASRVMTGAFCSQAMTQRTVSDAGVSVPPSCPCANGVEACAVGPSLESRRVLDVVIVEDTDPLLQGLRDELSPNLADLSGLIGIQAMASMIIDVDYPNGRTVARCSASDATCAVRPAVNGGNAGDVRSRSMDLSFCFPTN
jgi:hypothetical protein